MSSKLVQTVVDLGFAMQCNAETPWPFTQLRYPRIVPREIITERNFILAAVAEIDFSHRLTPYKIMGRSYLRK